MTGAGSAAEEFWEPHYAASAPGTGGPNPVLVDLVEALAPGRVLDLGCGGGGDALWLAQRGWAVLTVDVSATALARAADRTAGAGLTDRVRTERHDLTATFPHGEVDVISAQYLLSPVEFDRPPMFARAAAAVRAGGMLLIVDHASVPPWSWADPDTVFPTPEQTLGSIGLDPSSGTPCDWRITTGSPTGPTVNAPPSPTPSSPSPVGRQRRERTAGHGHR